MTRIKIQRNKPLNGLFEKIVLSSLLASGLLVAAPAVDPQLAADITAAKAEKAAADDKLKALESKLPQNQDIVANIKLGYMDTKGNTNTETFSLDGKAKKDFGTQYLSLVLDAQYGNADNLAGVNEVIKNKYFAELEYGYKVTDRFSITAVLGYKNDSFSSYNYQSHVGSGLKYLAYKSDIQKLDLEASVLYSSDDIQEQYLNQDGLESDYASYKAKLTYELQILENLKFDQELSYRASFDESTNYFAFSNSSLSSKISDIFSAGVSYKVDYTNIVAPTIYRADRTLTAFLSVDYSLNY